MIMCKMAMQYLSTVMGVIFLLLYILGIIRKLRGHTLNTYQKLQKALLQRLEMICFWLQFSPSTPSLWCFGGIVLYIFLEGFAIWSR